MLKATTRQSHARRRARVAAVRRSADARAGRAAVISGSTVVITRRRAPPLPVASLPECAMPEPRISADGRRHWGGGSLRPGRPAHHLLPEPLIARPLDERRRAPV